MARPRKFIRVKDLPNGSPVLVEKGGREIDGLSLNKTNQTFYSLNESGKRVYWGRDLARAIQDHRASLGQTMVHPITDAEALDRLAWEGIEEDQATPELIASQKRGRIGINNEWLAANPDKPLAVFVRTGKYPRKPKDQPKAGTAPRLQVCFGAWWSIMLESSSKPTQYMKDVKRTFDHLAKVLGNKPGSDLTADDFAKWRQWVTREQTKRNVTAKWHNDQHKYIKTVFNTIRTERPSWTFPDGLTEWQVLSRRIKSRTKYVPKSHNKQPIPVDVFHAVLKVVEHWADESLDLDTSTQSERGKKRCAIARRHRGLTAYAMFKLAANCGLDNADTATVTWDHIKNLDGELPYLDMSRSKIKNRFRVETDRKIPLLPATVKALKRLRQECRIAGTIFRTVQGSPHSRNSVYDQLEDAIIEARFDPRFPDGVKQNRTAGKRTGAYKQKEANGWTFKHLRNVGGKKRLGISKEERDHFLGHVEAGETKWYTGEASESYLVPLVNGIGAEYFDGDTVGR